tara:strand:+ start:2017 stop:2559 length:543 start_codon:yes stop_codon:yes gene_type:complete
MSKTKKISFPTNDGVSIWHYSYEHFHNDLKFKKKKQISFTPLNRFQSVKFFDKFILSILDTSTVFWHNLPYGTYEKLQKDIRKPLTFDMISSDFINIYKLFRNFKSVPLTKTIAINYEYSERKFNNYNLKWENTGIKIQFATKLRLYIIKVIKNRNFAATSIQVAWRRKKNYMTFFSNYK